MLGHNKNPQIEMIDPISSRVVCCCSWEKILGFSLNESPEKVKAHEHFAGFIRHNIIIHHNIHNMYLELGIIHLFEIKNLKDRILTNVLLIASAFI